MIKSPAVIPVRRTIWFISDHHFGQPSILSFKKENGDLLRPGFEDVHEMNDVMLEIHNKVVSEKDIVWLLGDLYSTRSMPEFFSTKYNRKMKGRLRFVLGNHDNAHDIVMSRRFGEVSSCRVFNDFGILATHRPVHESGLYHHKTDRMMTNVHGHIHYRDPPSEFHKNVSVERSEYRPVNVDELRIW